MKPLIARFFLFLAAFTLAMGQPMIPVNNISPVNANSLIGKVGTSGRAQNIPLGDGLSFVNGALTSTGGSASAPSDATYITQTPNATLTNEQPLSLLATGIVMVTTSTGVLTSLVPGTSGNVVTSNGTGWTSAAPSGNVTAAGTLTSGQMMIGQGGKASATTPTFSVIGSNATVTGNLTITGSTTFNNLTTSNLVVTGTFLPGSWINPVANGGTGVATLTANAVITGNGTGSVTSVSPGTSGNVLTSNGTAWTSAAAASGNVTGSGLTANAIIIGGGSNAVTAGASPGTSGNVLTSNGTAWTSAPASAGTVTVSGTPTSGQLAEWTSATNLQGISTANVTQGGTGRATGTTAYSIIATGTTATGAQQTLANGATTEILVGGGASALPVWTTASGTGAPARVGSPSFTGNIVLASGTGPTTGAAAATAFDTDAWAASRGAVQVHDGTANTYLVGTLASDTPSNGQVPTWNTGGTITWETPTGGSGTPGGSNTQLQYNNSGAFGGISGATTNGTAVTFTSANLLATSPRFTTSIDDANGLGMFVFTATALAVNRFTVANAATGGGFSTSPRFTSSGTDTNIDQTFVTKGSGGFNFSGPTRPLFTLYRDTTGTAQIGTASGTDSINTGSTTDDLCIRSNANKSLLISTNNGDTSDFIFRNVTSSVNGITFSPAISAAGPTIETTGSATNIDLNIKNKGSGGTNINGVTRPLITLLKNGSGTGQIGTASGTDSINNGSTTDDFCFRSNASKSFLFSADNGSTLVTSMTSTQLIAEKTTAATTTTNGALYSKGGLSVAGAVVAGGSGTFSQTGGIIGTTTNNNANAGSVGEYVESLIASGSAVSLTTATAANVTSISLTAGDWDVHGLVNYNASTATVTGASAGISTTSATLPTDGSQAYSGVQLTALSTSDSITLTRKRILISGTTTVYLVASSTFSAGTVGAFGTINARRVR